MSDGKSMVYQVNVVPGFVTTSVTVFAVALFVMRISPSVVTSLALHSAAKRTSPVVDAG